MTGALIILGATALIGFILWLLDRRHRKKERTLSAVFGGEAPEEATPQTEEEPECCGMHIVCEKTSLSPVTTEYEYFDDEELDRYAGRPADAYTEPEIDEFRDVLLTLRPAEIASWAKSVQLRGITLPAPIRDELLLIVAEAREKL